MDTSARQRNLDSAILFMQQDHANTLKGLHAEITALQKRCSELSFRIAMDNTSVSQEDIYRERAEALAKSLGEEQQKVEQLEANKEQTDKRVQLLEQQLKAQDRKVHDIKTEVKRLIHAKDRELQEKSDTIARLMAQLHSEKKKKTHDREVNKSASSSEGSPRYKTPTPPREAAPSRVRRRTSAGSSASVDSPGSLRPRPPSARPLAEDIPDPSPFLHPDDPSNSVVRKSEKSVLPPIQGQNNYSTMILPQKTDSYTFFKKGALRKANALSTSSPEVEVETLAVNKVTPRDHALRRAQEYNSSD